MKELLVQITACTVCANHLPFAPRPIIQAGAKAKILIIGQAPGLRVQQSGIPWDDKSGDNLRKWLAIDKETFYNPNAIALMPMGFCYPGKGRSGDLPPRIECAPLWHQAIIDKMKNIQLKILIGQYAQKYYLPNANANTTEAVKNYKKYLPQYFVLPHPSPRNNIWMAKNKWFEKEVLPALQKAVEVCLNA